MYVCLLKYKNSDVVHVDFCCQVGAKMIRRSAAPNGNPVFIEVSYIYCNTPFFIYTLPVVESVTLSFDVIFSYS